MTVPLDAAQQTPRPTGPSTERYRPVEPARRLPVVYDESLSECRAKAARVEGFLKPNEVDFLFLLGAAPSAPGEILEIGSFRGRSACILALGSRLADGATVHACDPLPGEHSHRGRTGLQILADNLTEAGVVDQVRIHQARSTELSTTWAAPIRLLWIDGDHSLGAAHEDLACFRRHLSPGAIVAMHDCLQPSPGPIRAFIEEILLAPDFGRFGMCGSIGWGQFLGPQPRMRFFAERMALFKRLARLVPYHLDPDPQTFLRRKLYLLWRALVPHGPVDPHRWVELLERP